MNRKWKLSLGASAILCTALTGLAGSPAMATSSPPPVIPPSVGTPPVGAPSMGPAHSGFVTAHGTHFMLNGRPFYYAGTNCYYLNYQSNYMIDDELTKAAKMGLKVVRMWGFIDGPASNGYTMQPSLGVYNTGANSGFERLDYADEEARKLGLKLIVTLVNNWDAFGGMDQYVNWVEGSSGKHDDFYTNPAIIKAYENYAKYLITRKNQYTGVVYKNDPTIMAWELANEPRDESDKSGKTLTAWVNTVSTYIHSIDHKHMIAVGDEGFMGSTTNYDYPYSDYEGVNWSQLVALPYVSYGTYHLYPDSYGETSSWGNQWITAHITAANQAGKPAVLEEFGLKDQAARDGVYQSWTNTVVNDHGAGDMFWMLSGNVDNGTPYPNYDGFAVYYPSSTATVLSYHASVMTAIGNGPPLPPSAPQEFTQNLPVSGSTGVSTTPSLSFSAALGAQGYNLVVSTNSNFSNPVISASDIQSTEYIPQTQLSDNTKYYWKVSATNATGTTDASNAGSSFTTTTAPTQPLIVDNFSSYASSAYLQSVYQVNSGGDPISVSLSSTHTNGAQYSMDINYTEGSNGYSGIERNMNGVNWSGYQGIQFWLQPDGTNDSITVQFEQESGTYWQTTYQMSGTTPVLVQLPFSQFTIPSWSSTGSMNLGSISQFSLYMGGYAKGNGSVTSNVYLDSIELYPTISSPVNGN